MNKFGTHYLNIKIQQGAGNGSLIWTGLLTFAHSQVIAGAKIALAFPGYREIVVGDGQNGVRAGHKQSGSLGEVLQIHGELEALEETKGKLLQTPFFRHLELGRIKSSEHHDGPLVQYRRYQRSGSERKYMKLTGDYRPVQYPFAIINSLSTHRRFSLFVQRTAPNSESEGRLDSYGLLRGSLGVVEIPVA